MRYFADTLSIERFRKLKNESISLSKKINVFSGQNGVGKSNLMSLIATTFGKSKKRIGRGNFQPEFYEYFTIPKNENYNDYKTYIKIVTDSQNADFIQKRHGYKDDSKRERGIRIIPRSTNYYSKDLTISDVSKNTKAKYSIGPSGRIPLPTVFLSLSRLYPVGETNLSSKNITYQNKLFQNDSVSKFIDWYNWVLPESISSNETKATILNKEKIESDGIYVSPENTTESTQSVGQDNLRSIINALVDFYNIKMKESENYLGGILCIDEIDASLHPSAQKRLLSLLDFLSEELDLQIFLTTHSLTILKEIINLKKLKPEDYNLIYLIDPIEPRIVTVNSYEELKADLFDEQLIYQPDVKFYCEDEYTEFLFKELIQSHKTLFPDETSLDNYNIIPVHLGANHLINLPKHDNHFYKVGIVLDGDAKTKEKYLLNKYINNDTEGLNLKTIKNNHLMFLPTCLAPESYMYFIIWELFHNPQFNFFWKSILSIPETRYYTKSRVNSEILSKITVTNDTSNDDIKNANITKIMKDFITKTQALANYYKINSNELREFFNKKNKIVTSVSNSIKSDY
ncbi:AAA family ATPase [Staphylococcus epidermidis]|uniref:AAA family ATPase n=1 Tax=Staphylococcus epidermidis TaxID=1282 RepID=UPI002093102F|nr:AAA family ATPase [Staphylococcus epidermidis]MCO6330796.1 AAA family ATPase [Staphylococcus epidermidis]